MNVEMLMWYEMDVDVEDNDTFFVTSKSFPELATFGDDMEAALLHARSPIEEAIAARIAHGNPVPCPMPNTTGKGYFVQVPALTFLKSALYMTCAAQGITRAELGRRLNWHREQVDRLFRIDHKSKLDQIEDAFRAIGVESIFSFPEIRQDRAA